MSKMSQLHMELSEQASELGFESLGEAEQAGYGVDWENARLVKVEDEQEKAHEAWLKEKEDLLERVDKVWEDPTYDQLIDIVNELVCFIEKGEV